MRVNVQVLRNNCLIGRGPLNDHTDDLPGNLFSGTKSVVSIVAEAATAGLDLDADVVTQALALPVEHELGTHFEYTQRGPDLLAHVVERAVGQDLQDYVQEHLFTPLGIDRDS